MLMSSDVSGIPSFLPPPPFLCVARFPLGAHTLRSLVKTRPETRRKSEGRERQGFRAAG